MNRRVSLVVVSLALAAAASGQPYSEATIHTFAPSPDGYGPGSLILASDGNLYGTSPNGGSFGAGTVFKVSNPATSPSLSVIYNFTGGADGGWPEAPLIQASDGNLYGTAPYGGSTGNGTVFEISKLSSIPVESLVYSFQGGDDGSSPYGGLIQASDGNLYGTTEFGGPKGYGTVFKISNPFAAPAENVVYAFGGWGDGGEPQASLIQASDGTLYGTTTSGGSYLCSMCDGTADCGFYNCGTVFKITNLSTFPKEAVLYEFIGPLFGGEDGGGTAAPVVLGPGGDLYGTTVGGGTNAAGSIFRITDPSGSPTFKTVHSFDWASGGAYPMAGLIQSADGVLYGTAAYGGSSNRGTAYKIANPSGSPDVIVLYDFAGTPDGAYPQASPVQDADGTLYGTTSGGGSGGSGTAYEITKPSIAPAESVLVSFPGGVDGSTYNSPPLIQGADGSLYGTTAAGGAGGFGTVFKISDISGMPVESLVYSFMGGNDGAEPNAALVEGADGNLYGTTNRGGGSANCENGCGTIFRVSNLPSPVETVLYSFSYMAYNYNDEAPLVQAADGSLFGVTRAGGVYGNGILYRILNPGGQAIFDQVYDFGATAGDGVVPVALLQAADGTLFGATTRGGANVYDGAVFKITNPSTSPVESVIYSFLGAADGSDPSSLIQGADGNLYGTCSEGGLHGGGTVFEIINPSTSPAGRPLYGFSRFDGWSALPSSLIQGADGNLYGTTGIVGSNNYGTVFEISDVAATPKENVLYSFRGVPDGMFPSSLMQAVDGNFYGSTEGSFPYLPGTVFKLSRQITMSPECGPAGGGTGVTVTGGHFDSTSRAWLVGINAPVVSVAPTQISLASPAGSAGAVGDVVVANQDGTSVTLPDRWGYDFLDVPSGNPFESFVCALARNRITAGCGGGDYCPDSSIQRNQMAVFVLRSAHGPTYVPPPATGTMFPDVPANAFAASFIEEAAREGIMGVGEDTACAAGLFCPSDAVTRLSMAYILLRGEHGGSYVPPSANCGSFPFLDVPCPSPDADYVGELLAEGITAGCDATHYCPGNPVTRAQMAVFLTATFGLQ